MIRSLQFVYLQINMIDQKLDSDKSCINIFPLSGTEVISCHARKCEMPSRSSIKQEKTEIRNSENNYLRSNSSSGFPKVLPAYYTYNVIRCYIHSGHGIQNRSFRNTVTPLQVRLQCPTRPIFT